MKKLTGKVVKRRRTVVESLVLVVLALVTASCAREIATYPPEWAPIDRRSDCEWIVGTYQNMSDAAPYPSTGYRHSLRMTEIMRFHAPHLGGDKVTLSFPEPGVLQIKGDGEQHFRFKKDDAACHDGHLELRSSDHDARYWSTMWGHDTIALTRSTDGALIARRDLSHWIFLFGFIPTHGFVREWYRFAPVSRN